MDMAIFVVIVVILFMVGKKLKQILNKSLSLVEIQLDASIYEAEAEYKGKEKQKG